MNLHSSYYEERLYPLQDGVLNCVAECGTDFFFTGGTALNRFYRPVRYSDDLDFFLQGDADGYYAFCPDLPGCQAQGATFEEADANVREAVALYLETLPKEELQSIGSTAVYSTTVDVAAYA